MYFKSSILMFTSLMSLQCFAGRQTIDTLNNQIIANAAALDYLIQDVCVDSLDRPVAGDPATCGSHRNVRIGEFVPYTVTDVDTINGNTRYQAVFSYPMPGADNQLKVLISKQMVGAGRPVINQSLSYQFVDTRDGYDLLDVGAGSYVSAIRTSDGGCFDQKISQSVSVRLDGWRVFPVGGPGSGGLVNHPIRLDRLNPILPPKCNRIDEVTANSVQSIWNPPVATTFESGKTLQAIQTYHVANLNLSQLENAIEKAYYTREYGWSRWEAWIPLSRCYRDNGAGADICNPNSPTHFLRGRCNPSSGTANWGNQTWVRVDCRDTTSFVALTNPLRPYNSYVAQSNGLVDIDSASVTDLYENEFLGNLSFSHVVGSANGLTWEAVQGVSGHMAYGPYTTVLPNRPLRAVFKLVTNSNAAPNVAVVNLDVFDATAGQIVGSALINRQSMASAYQEGNYSIDFDMTGRQGHAFEFRTWTSGANWVRLNRVLIQSR